MGKTPEKYKLDHQLRVRSEDMVWHLHEYDVDIKSNHIYLFGSESYAAGTLGSESDEPGIEYIIANRFIRNINLCMRANPGLPIVVHMKTCGGDWNSGMAIYDAIRSCPSPVTILSYAHARSMSSLILLSCNKSVMMPNSYFMLHNGTIGVEGTVKSVESLVEFNKKSTETMLNIYYTSMKEKGKFKGKSKKFIYEWLNAQMDKKEEVYLTAEETVMYGFADSIFGGDWKNLSEYTKDQLER